LPRQRDPLPRNGKQRQDRRTQSVLFNLARSWLKLAEELRDNMPFKAAVKDVDIFK
jgi:hypothetical protein